MRKTSEVSLEIEETLNQIVSEFSTNEMPIEVEMNSVVVDAGTFPKSEEMAASTSFYVMNMNTNSGESVYVLIYMDEQQVITYVHGRDSKGQEIAEKANAVGLPIQPNQ